MSANCTNENPCEICTELNANQARFELIKTLKANSAKMGPEGRLFANRLISHLEDLIDLGIGKATSMMEEKQHRNNLLKQL